MENNTTLKVAKKYHEMIETIEQDSDGYWAYANEGFIFQGMGAKTAREDTQKDLLAMIRTLEVDDSEDEAVEDEQAKVETVEEEQEEIEPIEDEPVEVENEPIETEKRSITGIEILVNIDSYVQGIHLNQEKTYSIHMSKDDEQANQDKLEEILYVALYRLDENVVIDTRVINDEGKINTLVRINHSWGNIELTKSIGGYFEMQEKYEREGYWKKRIKDFIKGELNEYQEGA